MAKVEYSAVGRRKEAVARVRLVPGDGKIVVNKRDIDNYFRGCSGTDVQRAGRGGFGWGNFRDRC